MSPLYSELASLAGLAKHLHGRGYVDDSAKSKDIQTTEPIRTEAETDNMVNAFESLKKKFDASPAQTSNRPVLQEASPGLQAKVEKIPSMKVPQGLGEYLSMDKASGMEALARDIRVCDKCPRSKTRHKAVPGQGNPQASIMIIADSPSSDDDQLGLPLTGSAGEFLDKWLEAIGFSRYSNAWLGTILKCRDNSREQDQDQSTADPVYATCAPYLLTQIALRKPSSILALGQASASWFAGRSIDLSTEHGLVLDWHGIPVTCTWHPSAVLRNEELKRPVWQDLKNFKARFSQGVQ